MIEPGKGIVCPLDAVLTVLRRRSVQVKLGVPCNRTASHSAMTRSGDDDNISLDAALDGYLGHVHVVSEASDAQLEDFRCLKETAGSDSRIIVEGPEGIRLLLKSDFAVEKLLLKPSLFDSLRASLDARLQRCHGQERPLTVYLCEAALMESVTGVPAKHASAALALALRKPVRSSLPDSLSIRLDAHLEPGTSQPLRLLAVDNLDYEAIGSLFRVAACFGVNAVLLSPTCADPFHRRAARVAMGHVFGVPAVHCLDLAATVLELRQKGVFTFACGTASEKPKESSDSQGFYFLDELASIPGHWLCAVGPAGPVMDTTVKSACESIVSIRLEEPDCPLGVGVVASCLLYGCVEREYRVGA
eukprot:TRINITY_DN36995_c0_g1_i1.p1 TRINITY_DN36995_c0_g1~~TRINITY_DN36995_c0_g1_i1.p1  ORF type:complete len:360 (+),score=37.58 TRINITY_DN36995_c0_g1_i1:467-1546(+)